MLKTSGRLVEAKTTLPPGIPGSPCAYLLLQTPLFRSTAHRPLALLKRLAVRVVWWGEDANSRRTSPGGTIGLVLHPRIAGQKLSKQHCGCQARYPVCVPLRKMHSYLEDMGSLFLDVIDEKTGAIMGRARLENLARLTPQDPIRSVVAVANVNGSKIGELTVSLSFEVIQANRSDGLLRKNYSLPKVLGDSLEPLETKLAPKSSEFVNELPMMEKFTEKVNLNEPDRDVHSIKEASADDVESNLSVEVLARIQSALAESRRIRQLVSAEFDAERKILGSSNHFPNNQLKPAAVETLDLRKADSHSAPDLAIQPEIDFVNVESLPYESESYPGLLDSIDSQDMLENGENKDCIPNNPASDLSDADLEKDLIIENVLLPNVMEAAQIGVKVVDQTRPVSEAGAMIEEPKITDHSLVNLEGKKSCSPGPPMGIRFAFRRLTFPVPIWNALWVVLATFTDPSEKRNAKNAHFQEDKRNLGSLKSRSDFDMNKSIMKNVRARSKSNRNDHVIQKRSADKPFSRALFKTFHDITGAKPWNLFLEILISASFINKESSADQAFHSLQEDSLILCRRINLCRRLSRQVLTDSCPNRAFEDPDVTIVPQRAPDGDSAPDVDSIIISLNDFEDGNNALIHLSILCGPSSPIDAPITRLIGTIRLNLIALISAMYQSPCSKLSKSQSASPKTLRVRIDFVNTIEQRLLKLLGDEHPTTLLNKSFGFVNIEPVLSMSEFVKTASPVSSNFQNNEKISQPFVVRPFYLDVLLNIRGARDLRLSHPTSASLQNSFLVVRIPWCTEETFAEDHVVRKAKRFQSAVAWNSGATPTYHFGLRVSAVLFEEQIARLSKSFIAVEVWARRMDHGLEKDELVGLAKVITSGISSLYRPFQEQYRNSRAYFLDPAFATLPAIQEDSWLQVISPTTGRVCGQLRSRFSAGTPVQISALLDVDCENAGAGCLDWRPIDFAQWKQPSTYIKFQDHEPGERNPSSEALLTLSVTHMLDIQPTALTIFQPDFSATLRKELGANTFLYSDCDCFVQYRIPFGKDLHASAFRSTILRLQSIRKPEDIQASLQIKESGTTGADEMDIKDSSSGIELKWQDEAPGGWHEVLDHTFVMESARESEILRNIGEMDSYAFLDWLGRDRLTQGGIPFELWLRLYSPKLREIQIAEGSAPWELLEKHLMPAPSMSKVDKVVDFPHSWQRDLSQHALPLYDVLTNKFAGRIMLNVKYRLISTIQCSTDLETKYSANNDTSCSLCHHGKMPVYQLLPSTAHPGIRLNVSLLSLMGLGSTKTLEIRMHCLLLLPPTNFCPRHVVFPRLLASSALISPVSMLAGDSKEQKKMRLDILLPLAWKYNALVENRLVCSRKPSEREKFTAFSLAEALAFGAVEINDRHSWLTGRVNRPCLIIQVDVWDLIEGSYVSCQENSKPDAGGPVTFWGIDYDSESGLKLRPSSRHHLLATCRVTLSDLLFSGSLPPRLVALLQVPSSQKSSLLRIPDPSLSAMPNRLAGAIEISAFFEDTSAKRKILEEVRSLALPRAFQSLRELGFDWTSMAPSSRVLGVNRNIDLNDDLRELTLCFTSIRLPKESSLLDPFEQETCKERTLRGYFFIRASLDADIHISNLHPLPIGSSDKSSIYGKCGITQFQDTLTFCTNSGLHSKKSALEIQVWAKWLSPDNAIEIDGVPVPRFLGLVRLPLSHVFRRNLSSDPEEVFYWSCAPWGSAFILNSIAVYPLFQPSVSSMDDCWVAFMIVSGKEEIQHGNHLTFKDAIPEHGILVWHSEGQMPSKSPTFEQISSPPKVDTFPAYISIERANRLSSDSILNDVEKLETFAIFMVADDNPFARNSQRMVATPLAINRVEPVWNYRRYARLHLFYINSDAKCFTVDLWQRAEGHQHPYHLGTAKMPLAALTLPRPIKSVQSSTEKSPVGLEFMRGWYEVYDTQGNSRGQLLMGVYPLAENEENPNDCRLCQRLERLLDPGNAVDVEENQEGKASSKGRDNPIFGCNSSVRGSSPLNSGVQQITSHVSWDMDSKTTSFLLNSLRSRMEELDVQNARFKQKLLELADSSSKGSATLEPVTELQQNLNDEVNCSGHQNVFIEAPPTDNLIYSCGSGNSNPRTEIASSSFRAMHKSDSSEKASVQEPPKVNASDSKSAVHLGAATVCSQNGSDIADSNDIELQVGNATEANQLEDAFEYDSISLASTATLSSVSSLLMKKHFSCAAADVPIQQNVDPDCPSSWSASSTDVEAYVQQFQQSIKDKKAEASAFLISDETCMNRGNESHSRRMVEVIEISSIEDDEQMKVVNHSDDNSEGLPLKNTENDILEEANASVTSSHLQAANNHREVADSSRFQQPQMWSLQMPSPTQDIVEDPIHQGIPIMLSSITDECLQGSEAILKSSSRDDPVLNSTQLRGSNTSDQPHSGSLARVARIFEMNL